MAKASRDKGARFEREICTLFNKAGIPFRRNFQAAGGFQQGADVSPVNPAPDCRSRDARYGLLRLLAHNFWHECKSRQKQFGASQIYQALEQARRDSVGSDKLPAVFMKIDRHEPLLLIPIKELVEELNNESV